MPGKIISLVNFKGGVGKATLTVNLAACMAKEYDKKVLTVDLDPQSNSSIWLMGPALCSELNSEANLMRTTAAMFYRSWTPDICVRPFMDPDGDFLPNLYLCPASPKLSRIESEITLFCNQRRLAGTYRSDDEHLFFSRAARLLRQKFDLVLVDCPPNLYLCTRNAFCHSDYILIPCVPDTLSTSGLKMMIETMDKTLASAIASGRVKRSPFILGVAVTRFRANTNEHQSGLEIMEQTVAELGSGDHLLVNGRTSVFRDQPIREYVVHAEAVHEGLPLCMFSPASPAYNEVQALTKVIMENMGSLQ